RERTHRPPAAQRARLLRRGAAPAGAAADAGWTIMTGAVDPYARFAPTSPRQFLYGLNPLAKVAAVLPAIVLLVFVRDIATPAAFLVLSYGVLLVGARITVRTAVLLLGALPLGILLIGTGFSIWVDAGLVADTVPVAYVGGWTL